MPIKDPELKERLARQEWTAHNIRLTNKISTRPGEPDFLATDMRLRAISRTLDFCYDKQLEGLRVADLGCLEGGFSLALAQRGAEVLGIEVRERNVEKCLLLKEHFGLGNLNFVMDDVKNFTVGKYGKFDVILALGILYHLDRPVQWLRQISNATSCLLFIETHYAPPDDHSMQLMAGELAKNLGPLITDEIDGCKYQGRWYQEFANDESWSMGRETCLWASYSNLKSLWLTKESLLMAVLNSGFSLFLEQHDSSRELFSEVTNKRSRALFVAVR